jgi:hypothetical protein
MRIKLKKEKKKVSNRRKVSSQHWIYFWTLFLVLEP